MSSHPADIASNATSDRPDERLADFEQLVWAMLDEQISDDDRNRLQQLIESDELARATYIECVQMHVDLQNHFAADAKEDRGSNESPATAAKSPVLGFLNQGAPAMPLMPTHVNPPGV
jgi:anti-sigma factor RsiW